MTTYIIKRLLLMIPTLFGITFLTYVIIRSAPGDPTSMKMEEGRGPQRNVITAGDQGDYRKLLHLDKDPVTAYFLWAGDFFVPERNVSSKYKEFVFNVILNRLPNTLALNAYSLFIFYLLGIPLGIDSAVNARSVRERVITVILFLLYSLPSFWIGLVLIVFLGQGGALKNWLPEGLTAFRHLAVWTTLLFTAIFVLQKTVPKTPDPGSKPGGAGLGASLGFLRVLAWTGAALFLAAMTALIVLAVGDSLSFREFAAMLFQGDIPTRMRGLPIAGLEPENAQRLTYVQLLRSCAPYYLMPVFCIFYSGLASESRFMRVGMMGVLREDYIRTARAKGLPERKVILRHALPNALTPIIVGLAAVFPALFSGAVIVESLFSIPGMGLLFVEAVQSRDYNLIMAEAFVGAVLVLFGILLSDLMLPLLDPRVTFEKE